ncbi:NAD(P)-binding protein [Chytriomyces sp. MP71]|nr:NAD(P)-binding protein [Chytriomyces sp. MP71]KAI8615021.1 NAD(P)-binding protein [Chytriomyces sp. MP71]
MSAHTGQSPPNKKQHMSPVTVIVVGAGQRGNVYGDFCKRNPSLATVVGVAETHEKRRSNFVAKHAIAAENVYDDFRSIPRGLAQAAVVSTLDDLHVDMVVHLASLGYHIMCEKPMATTLADCERMRTAVKDNSVLFACGHVLRYSPYTRALKNILDAGDIGDIVNINHIEPVGWYHFAHSFVRGNWRNEAQTSFSLMTKCCHDIDLLLHYMTPNKATRVSSFGGLYHFKKSQKPKEAGIAKNCLDCKLKDSCAYSATQLYVPAARRLQKGWPVSVVCEGSEVDAATPQDLEDLVLDKLRHGPYGNCVYEIEDNDVCDQQVVNIEFEGGKTASLTMIAFTEAVCQRTTRIHGTKGEIIGDMSKFTVFNFETREKREVDPSLMDVDKDGTSGHGGGDSGLMHAFIRAINAGDQSTVGCDVDDVFNSHALVFAAEESRRNGTVVSL